MKATIIDDSFRAQRNDLVTVEVYDAQLQKRRFMEVTVHCDASTGFQRYVAKFAGRLSEPSMFSSTAISRVLPRHWTYLDHKWGFGD